MFNLKAKYAYANIVLNHKPKKGILVIESNSNYYKKWAIIAIVVPFVLNYYLVRNNDFNGDVELLLLGFFPTILFSILGLSLFIKSRQKSEVVLNYKRNFIQFKGQEIPFSSVKSLLLSKTAFSRPLTNNLNNVQYTFQLILQLKNGNKTVLVNSDNQQVIIDSGEEISRISNLPFDIIPF